MNTKNNDDCIIDGGYAPDNGEEKTLCVLVLDDSGSMSGIDASGESKISQVQKGIDEVKVDIASNPQTSQKVEMCIELFNHAVRVVQKPALVENINMPTLCAGGGTNLSGAVLKAIDEVAERKAYYVEHGIPYKRPIIVLLTDGQAPIDSIVEKVKKGSAEKHYFIIPIAVGDDADMVALNKIASDRAYKIKDGHISSFFRWLSNSLGVIANADPDAPVDLENPFSGWAVNG